MTRCSTLQANVFRKSELKSIIPKLTKGKSMKTIFKTAPSNTFKVKNKMASQKVMKTSTSIKVLNKQNIQNKLGYKYRNLWKQKKIFSIEKDFYSHKLAIQQEKENKFKQILRTKKKRTNFLIKIGALKPKALIS
jgi:hypothetical protein